MYLRGKNKGDTNLVCKRCERISGADTGSDAWDARAEYRLIAKKGEGTFSEVLKAQCVKNGKMTAIKCMKSQFESEEQVRCPPLSPQARTGSTSAAGGRSKRRRGISYVD